MKNIFQKGFILPSTILLGLGIAIVSTTFLQFTSNTSVQLTSRNLNALAAEAARSGIVYANSCVEANSTDWSSLTPMTDCAGNTSGSHLYIVNTSDYRTTFTVANPDDLGGNLEIVSTGTVQQLNSSGSVVNTVTQKAKTILPDTVSTRPVATGVPITDIENNEHDCAVANGELYCWGSGASGKIGDGASTDRAHPTKVGGAIAGKTVTYLSVGTYNTCVSADGLPYCWGSGGNHQLGHNSFASRNVPTAGSPLVASGPLAGYYIPEVDVSDFNNPAIIWPFSIAVPHTQALRHDGAMATWGDGGYRQNSGGGCIEVLWICTGFFYYPSYDSPVLFDGYANADAPIAGKKAERIGASSHDGCLLAQGRMYCAGVEVPLPLLCNSVLFSAAWMTIVPFNPCVASFSDGYDMSAKSHWITGYTLNNKLIDAETFDISTNVGCGMANRDFWCIGNGPAVGALWSGSWSPPWVELSDADVTSHDNGDNPDSASFDGIYCIVDAGIAKCQGSSWQGGGGIWSWNPITSTGFTGKVPTKIAAGQQHGCVIANGQLYCWGDGAEGVLANGSTASFWSGNSRGSAQLSGTGGATPIGTTDGTYAADGSISTGDGHSCGVSNGQLFCWGRNDYGQLGIGSTTEQYQPVAPPSTVGQVYRDVSTGAHHTCAIRDGQLYCWGRNTNGQLGVGDTNVRTTPTLVSAFAGMRVQRVSAGDTGTCAIVNGHAYCWGLNTNQQVGDGTTIQRTSPVAVIAPLAGKSIRAITIGNNHACAVGNGDLYCWGSNADGRTGLNTTIGNANPTLVDDGSAGAPLGPNGMRPLVTDVSAGEDFTCAVINSTVDCWGSNANGRTGRTGVVSGSTLVPTAISNTYFATKVDAGDSHACALLHGNNSRTNGNMWCWGNATSGRVGNGAASGDVSTPVVIAGGDNAGRSGISISAGASGTCAVAKGTIQCWGFGGNGRNGNGGTSNLVLPSTTADYTFYSPYQKGPIF